MAQTFPPSEDTVDLYKNFVRKQAPAEHIRVPFAAGCTQKDMIVVLPWCGIADETVAAAGTAEVSIHVEGGILVESDEIAAAADFSAVGTEVWFNAVTGEYQDDEEDGLYLVGYVLEPTNTDGVFVFEKRRYVEVGVST
jgi:hypothetical protein